jgi:hypothetical protein
MVVLEDVSRMPTEHPGVDQLEAAVVEFMSGRASTRAGVSSSRACALA